MAEKNANKQFSERDIWRINQIATPTGNKDKARKKRFQRSEFVLMMRTRAKHIKYMNKTCNPKLGVSFAG